MKKLLPIFFLLCSVSVFAEEEGQDLPTAKGECISPFALFIPFFTPLMLLAFYLFISGLVYVIAEIAGKRGEDEECAVLAGMETGGFGHPIAGDGFFLDMD